MDNTTLANQFKLLSKLMTLHEENPFKIRSYSNAANQIERLPIPIATMKPEAINKIKGVGTAIEKKIRTILDTGHFPLLEEYKSNTPPGILEMLHIKGIGPKKIIVIWKELEIETPGELLYACEENRLTLYKGFGAKTQESIREAIAFYLKSVGYYLYSEAIQYADELLQFWQNSFGTNASFEITGDLRRQANTVSELSFITTVDAEVIKQKLPKGFEAAKEKQKLILTKKDHPKVILFICEAEHTGTVLFETTGNTDFVSSFYNKHPALKTQNFSSEDALFTKAGCASIPSYLREQEFSLISVHPEIIQPKDIKGIIHSHSKWSDGKNSLEEMARAAQKLGMEYLVISDHSRSAGYANGLKPDRIKAQQEEIDKLNQKLTPFKIFKSIESDILSDGNLDYEGDLLATFDLVIASVHSNLKMDQGKAMQRLLKAIENPFTTILGHLTGRLLLSRPGYPIDHKKIIDACVKNQVAIEINAHPRRLDIDWSWIPYALQQKALLSIDPDAHTIKGLEDTKFGVLSAQKGGLTGVQNLSSFSRENFENYLAKRKEEKGL